MRKIYTCVLNLLFVATIRLCLASIRESQRAAAADPQYDENNARTHRKISVFVFKRKRQREGNGLQRSTHRDTEGKRSLPPSWDILQFLMRS